MTVAIVIAAWLLVAVLVAKAIAEYERRRRVREVRRRARRRVNGHNW